MGAWCGVCGRVALWYVSIGCTGMVVRVVRGVRCLCECVRGEGSFCARRWDGVLGWPLRAGAFVGMCVPENSIRGDDGVHVACVGLRVLGRGVDGLAWRAQLCVCVACVACAGGCVPGKLHVESVLCGEVGWCAGVYPHVACAGRAICPPSLLILLFASTPPWFSLGAEREEAEAVIVPGGG